jgi:hypothetical protein
VKGQRVFGGVERKPEKTFLVPVSDRTADTSMTIISDWFEPGTEVTSDCWLANIETQGYTHQTVIHTIGSVDKRTGANTNTIERNWRHVKAFINP